MQVIGLNSFERCTAAGGRMNGYGAAGARILRSGPLRAASIALFAMAFFFALGTASGGVSDEDIATLGEVKVAGAPFEGDSPSIGGVLTRLALSLGAVCGLIFIASWLARKYFPSHVGTGRGGLIEIVSTRVIGPRKSLMLVRVQDKTILIGATQQSFHFLSEIEQGTAGWDEAAERAGLRAAAGPEHRA